MIKIDSKVLFSQKYIDENIEYRDRKKPLVGSLFSMMFENDFMDFYKEKENEIISYDHDVSNELLEKALSAKTGIDETFLMNFYKLYEYSEGIKYNYNPKDVLDLNLDLLITLKDMFDKDKGFGTFMEFLMLKYAQEAFNRKDLPAIDAVFKSIEPQKYIGILASTTYYPTVKNNELAFSYVPTLWALVVNKEGESIFNRRHSHITRIIMDIDGYKNELKEILSAKQSELVDELFCDGLKSYILGQVYFLENKNLELVLDLLEKGYDEAFEKTNDISFLEFVRNQAAEEVEDNKKDPEWSSNYYQSRLKTLTDYYNKKTPELNFHM